MATTDELDTKVRYLESEIEGEKLLTRHALEQGRRITAEVGAARLEISAIGLRLDAVAGDAVELRAAARNHGTLIGMLQRDVTAIRSDVTALRRGQEELHARIDQLQADMTGRVDQLQADMTGRVDQVQADVGALRQEVAEVNRKIDAILVAVTPPRT